MTNPIKPTRISVVVPRTLRALVLLLAICSSKNLSGQSTSSVAPATAPATTATPTTSPSTMYSATSNAAGTRGSLLAHATGDTYWIARVGRERREDSTSPDRSVIYARTLGEAQWKQFTTLRGRVVSLTDRRGELVALMADGQWLTIWSDGSSLGSPPPSGVRLRTLAAGPQGLVALGTTGSTGSTQPASAGLYLFEGGAWVRRLDLPISPDLVDDGGVRSVARAADVFFALPPNSRNESIVYRINAEAPQAINETPIALGTEPVASIDLFVSGERVVLGVVYRTGAVRVTPVSDAGAPVLLAAPSAAAFETSAATFAAENYRLLLAGGETISEQSYRVDGSAVGQLTKLSFGAQGEPVNHWNQFIVMFGIAIMLFAVSRRKGGAIVLPAQLGVRLAPILPRLAAGTVDALPLLITAGVLSYRFDFNQAFNADVQSLTAQQAWWMSLATAFYLLHTSISELLTGRTLGKWIFKLWVVSIDSQPARPGQIVTRNLLRFLDVSMAGFPLLLLFASPLRQRVGDLAAGTMVVAKTNADPSVEVDAADSTPNPSIDLESDEKPKP